MDGMPAVAELESGAAASSAVDVNSEFRLSERSRFDAAVARAVGVLAGAGMAASTMVRDEVTRRGGSGSRLRLSGTCVWARTSSMDTSFAAETDDPRAWEERAGRDVTGAYGSYREPGASSAGKSASL